MHELVVIDLLGHIDRMLIKCRQTALIETMDVVNDLLDMRAVVSTMATPSKP